jgi:DNA polymerase-3 subunit epsilon
MSGLPLIGESCFAGIDFESAGAARGRTDVPVQIGMATWSPLHGHGRPFVSFLRTGRPITWAARKVHGITPDDLAGAPTLVSLWPELRTRLDGAVVVAHGKGTERRFLRAFPGHPFGPWIDTLLLARAAWPELPGHGLGELCRHLSLTATVDRLCPGRRWHDALYDAVASLVVLEHLVGRLELAGRPVDALVHPDTSAWHRRQRLAQRRPPPAPPAP